MKRNEKAAVTRLLRFIDASPTPFHAAENLASELEAAGYARLSEEEPWTLEPGGKYFVTRNKSSLIALRLPKGEPAGFSCAASHTDSPGFRPHDPMLRMDRCHVVSRFTRRTGNTRQTGTSSPAEQRMTQSTA